MRMAHQNLVVESGGSKVKGTAMTAKQVRADSAADEQQIKEVVARAAQGDPFAFATLYERYHSYVIKTAFYILRRQEDAEDVAHNVWRKLLLHLEQYPREVRFSTWLYRVVCNEAIDHMRRARADRQVQLDAFAEQEATTLSAQAARHRPAPDQEIDFLQTRIREELMRALELLQLQHSLRARCFALHYLQEMSVGEIVDQTHLSEGTVKSHLYYARKYLMQEHPILLDLYYALQEKLGKSRP
jgi:RNA polymerase sigma-70 factor (ECF subfamily)